MRNLGKWFWLLNKRLYKKITFLLILILIPILVISFGNAAQESSGVMTIALAQEAQDPMATQVIEKFKSEPSLVNFILCDTPEAALKMIEDGKADAAWIFPDEMENRMYRFIQSPNRFNSFIRVVESSDSVPLRLTREKLSGTVFGFCSRLFYLNYLRENVPELADVPDASLLQHYDDFAKDTNLFDFTYLDGGSGSEDLQSANYLTAPLRGLLAVIVVLAGLAAAMYYMQDNAAGTFSLVPLQHRSWVEFACQMIAVVNTSVVMLVALFFSGLTESIGRELLVLLLYCLSVTLFCMNIRRWCRKLSVLGTFIPLLLVVMLVICPVFFDIAIARAFQYLFPPTYYINAMYSDRYLLLLCVYNAVACGLYILSGKLLRRD